MNKQPKTTAKDILSDFYNEEVGKSNIPNFEFVKNRSYADCEEIYKLINTGESANLALARNYDKIKDTLPKKWLNPVIKILEKMKEDKGYWDKSPARVGEDKIFPSMTSLTEILHPKQDRQLTIREYARIMGYPDDFIFNQDECKTPIIQCIAQGVPVNFVNYITTEVKEALSDNREYVDLSDKSDTIVNFQHNIKEKYKLYNIDDINNAKTLDIISKDAAYKLMK
jgi:site-specific DNA-cytosine methylase